MHDPQRLGPCSRPQWGERMPERHVKIQELHANLSGCLEEVRCGTTLLLTDGGQRVARLVPEPQAIEAKDTLSIVWSRRKLKKTRPKARLRGGGSMMELQSR